MYVDRNTETRGRNDFCCGKTISIITYLCVCVCVCGVRARTRVGESVRVCVCVHA